MYIIVTDWYRFLTKIEHRSVWCIVIIDKYIYNYVDVVKARSIPVIIQLLYEPVGVNEIQQR